MEEETEGRRRVVLERQGPFPIPRPDWPTRLFRVPSPPHRLRGLLWLFGFQPFFPPTLQHSLLSLFPVDALPCPLRGEEGTSVGSEEEGMAEKEAMLPFTEYAPTVRGISEQKFTSSARSILELVRAVGETLGMPTEEESSLPSGSETGMTFVRPGQVDVVPMEEEEEEDEAVLDLDTSGPFSNLPDLKSRLGHLSVFLHYLLSNSDPASLLFYLITELYESGTSGKELRKWAYEIHSSFLTPTAPLRVGRLERDVVAEIDSVLAETGDSAIPSLRKVFVKSRQRALDDIRERLNDFRSKLQLGLGNVFGMAFLDDLQAADGEWERVKELKAADALLMPHFETFFTQSADYDKLAPRSQAVSAALATVVKSVMGFRPSCHLQEKLLDRCPLFCARERGFKHKIRISASKRSVSLKGHQLNLTPVTVTTACYQCQEMVWGLNPQAYFCAHCDVVVHKACMGSLEDHCYPASQAKGKPSAASRALPTSKSLPQTKSASVLPIHEEPEGSSQAGVEDEERDRVPSQLPGSPRTKGMGGVGDWSGKSSDSGYEGDGDRHDRGPINRSQSMKTRDENVRGAKRLALELSGRRAKSDVDVDDKSIALAMGSEVAGASSSSSLHSTTAATGVIAASADLSDSDLDADPDIPMLDSLITPETVKLMKPKEKRRQEVINELFHTERTHVGKLKLLHRHFYTPLLVNQILPPDVVKLLFGNIEEILEFHESLNNAMKSQRKEEMSKDGLFGNVGELMCNVLDGECGEKFAAAAADFCQHQQYALSVLNIRRKKDSKLGAFLTEAESAGLCRRLQLKDLIPVEMQRLTKYPLLLETIEKYTGEGSEEAAALRAAAEAARRLLSGVNRAKRQSEDRRKLGELQARLDTHSLVHDGHLAWRLGKNKTVELHVVLLEEIMVLMTRVNSEGRLSLKYYDMTQMPDGKWCPVLKLSSLIAKTVATDKKAFFLVCTSASGPQIYELVASTMQEKKSWLRAINEQAEICKVTATKAPLAEADAVSEASAGELRQTPAGLRDVATSPAAPGTARDVERIAMTSQPRLINPADVRVAQPTIYQHAKPVLTPLERIRRQDALLLQAMQEKQEVLAELMNLEGGPDELHTIAQSIADGKAARDTKELVMSAIVQSNRLLEAINDGMKVEAVSSEQEHTESKLAIVAPEPGPSVPCLRLATIAAPLIKHLTCIMQSMQSSDEELRRLRIELSHYKSLCEGKETPGDSVPPTTDSDLGSSPSSVASSFHVDEAGGGSGVVGASPKVAIGCASSEETLTGTPLVKTPDSLPHSPSPSSRASLSPAVPNHPVLNPALHASRSLSPSPLPSAKGPPQPPTSSSIPASSHTPASLPDGEAKVKLTEKRKQKRERQAAHLTPDSAPEETNKFPK